MNNLSIRKALITDLEIIQKLNQKLCVKENKEYDSTINSNYSFTKEGEEYFKSRIEETDSFVLIVEENKHYIGYLVGAIVISENYRNISKIAEVENMYIDNDFQGKGIGSELIKQFEDWCVKNNVKRIRYVASAKNNEAIKFYKKTGAEELNVILEKKLD